MKLSDIPWLMTVLSCDWMFYNLCDYGKDKQISAGQALFNLSIAMAATSAVYWITWYMRRPLRDVVESAGRDGAETPRGPEHTNLSGGPHV